MKFYKKISSDIIGDYEELPFSKVRKLYIGALGEAVKKHYAGLMAELDITNAMKAIHEYKDKTENKISFTAWIAKCISQAMVEYKQIHSIRKGDKIIIFDDVDILVIVEKEVNDERIPLAYIVRKANSKNLQEISDELENAKKQEMSGPNVILGEGGNSRDTNSYIKGFLLLPKFIRNWILSRVLKSPFIIKKHIGTVMLSSIGMFGQINGSIWGLPLSVHPVCFALGNIVKRSAIINDEMKVREYLNMTMLFDHDTVDGGPATRFISELSKMIENAHGIEPMKMDDE